MNKEQIDNIVKRIKQSFRLYMNGVAAASMKKKGLDYKISWGVSLQHLQEIAKEYGKNYKIADALWQSDVRECKILALMMYPPEEMKLEELEIIMKQIKTQELAEFYVVNILQYLSFGSKIALRWVTNQNNLYKICAYNLFGRLFMKSVDLEKGDLDLYIKHVSYDLAGNNVLVKHSVLNSLIHLAEMKPEYEELAINLHNEYAY